MNPKQNTKIVFAKDYTTSHGILLSAGHEVFHEDFEGDLVVISFEYESGGKRFFAEVSPDFLEEITYGAISRQPFARTSTQTLDEEGRE